MTLVFQIAAGIVVAVLVLRYWPFLLTAAVGLLALALVVGLGLYVYEHHLTGAGAVIAFGGMAWAAFAVWKAQEPARQHRIKRGAAMVLRPVGVAALWIGTGFGRLAAAVAFLLLGFGLPFALTAWAANALAVPDAWSMAGAAFIGAVAAGFWAWRLIRQDGSAGSGEAPSQD